MNQDRADVQEDIAEPVGVAEPENELDKAIEELRGITGTKDCAQKTAKPAEPEARTAGPVEYGVIMGIPVDVQVVLGGAEMSVADLMALKHGSTVALDRRIGEPVDLVVNGRKVARGEITVLEDDATRFGIRITEVAGR